MLISSPLMYPATSSPRDESARKRRKLDSPSREPLQDVTLNAGRKHIAPFVLDDSDDNENEGDDTLLQTKTRLSRAEETTARYVRNETPLREPGIPIPAARPINGPSLLHTDSLLPPSMFQKTSGGSSCGTIHVVVTTCSGNALSIRRRVKHARRTYEEMVAERSLTASAGKAQKSYYGIDIHNLVEEASTEKTAREDSEHSPPEDVPKSIEMDPQTTSKHGRLSKTMMWTEKYRARKFTDLVGDERTHRSVLRWLKAWDPIVFPSAARPKPKQRYGQDEVAERQHRKILLLTGPPGLGKTTLAHVCAKQAGYEVQEINASDERSRDVVKGRIRDMVGTENVRPVNVGPNGKSGKATRPVCVVVDEVDGVVSGNSNGGGEGGFIKALADLIALDQKNCNARPSASDGKQRKKGDNFRLLRPVILICNDVYHPSLRLLRSGTMAEIIYVRKPALNMVVPRIQAIFEKEGVPCDIDGVRSLCEASWGVGNRKEDKATGGASEGDIRGLLVVGEWVAAKLRVCTPELVMARLTKRWVEQNMLGDLGHGGGAARSIGRGGSREVVERVFVYNAGFPTSSAVIERTPSVDVAGAVDIAKQRTTDRLREIIELTGEDDRIMSDCFATYSTLPFQDDTFLSKPCSGSEWLHFHDRLSSRVHNSSEWELAPYLSSPVLAFHHLFASNSRHSYPTAAKAHPEAGEGSTTAGTPFTGLRASYEAFEATKANKAALQHLHSKLSLHLHRAFRSADGLAAELLPYLLRMLSPDVKPVVVGGSDKGVASVRRGAEKQMVLKAVEAMIACGVTFEKSRVDMGESGFGATSGWVYRMEPGLDALGVFETKESGAEGARTRFAVRQVLEQEWKREVVRREQEARVRRMRGEDGEVATLRLASTVDKKKEPNEDAALVKSAKVAVKRDFFGRPMIRMDTTGNGLVDDEAFEKKTDSGATAAKDGDGRIYVSYHEGYSNAVRKGITLKELLDGL